jgi:alcohol dehydrogenase class IV
MGIELEIPQRLSDVGIKESDLDFIAAEAMKQ